MVLQLPYILLEVLIEQFSTLDNMIMCYSCIFSSKVGNQKHFDA